MMQGAGPAGKTTAFICRERSQTRAQIDFHESYSICLSVHAMLEEPPRRRKASRFAAGLHCF